jgi:uncharacterized protein (DUF433 family)
MGNMSEIEFWRDCPETEQDADKLHGEPTVGPYRVAARTVIECEELGETPEEIAEDYGLPLEKVNAILRYYHAREAQLAKSR